MSTTVTNSTASSAANAATSGNNTTGLKGDFNTFLKMLTTQLQNQDPTQPMDTNQMTQQLVQFSTVEQLINMNGNLTSLVDLQQTSQLTASSALIGKTLAVESDKLALQNGKAALQLPAAGTATAAHIAIVDAFGRTLKEADVPLTSTSSTWTWDGRNTGGKQLPDGAYSFVVSGRDASGAAATLSADVLATATAAEKVSNGSGGTDLRLNFGALQLPFSDVRSIR